MFLLIHHSSLTSIHVIAEISFLSNRIQDRPRVSEVLKFRLVLTQLNCVLFLWSSCENRIAGKKTIALAHHCAQKGLGFETCNWAKLKTPVGIHAITQLENKTRIDSKSFFLTVSTIVCENFWWGMQWGARQVSSQVLSVRWKWMRIRMFSWNTTKKKTLMKHAWFTQLSDWGVFSFVFAWSTLRFVFRKQPKSWQRIVWAASWNEDKYWRWNCKAICGNVWGSGTWHEIMERGGGLDKQN